MRNFFMRLADLISVKTIITTAVMYVFVRLCLEGRIPVDTITSVVIMVIGFYFGTVYQRNIKEEVDKDNE